jgi:hypothetical protein
MTTELNSLDELTPTEMQIFAGLFISRAEDLPKGAPRKAKLLQAASRLLDLSSQWKVGLSSRPRFLAARSGLALTLRLRERRNHGPA